MSTFLFGGRDGTFLSKFLLTVMLYLQYVSPSAVEFFAFAIIHDVYTF